MDISPKERLHTLAHIAFAIVQCPECMDGEISAADPKKDEAALRLASDAWKKGQFPNLSENDVVGMMKSVLSEASPECSECASDISDDYDLKTMHMSTEDLDKSATLIYNRVEHRDVKEIYQYIDEIRKLTPGDNRIELLRLSIEGVLHEYQYAYQGEVAARRAAPIWHTRERNEERAELKAAKSSIDTLRAKLEDLGAPEARARGEWERYQSDYRAIRSAQDRLKSLESKSEQLSRIVICIGIAIILALCGDAWSFLKPGDLYREAGKLVIGACGLVTLFGPFLLFAVFRESRTARVELSRYGPSLARQAGIATETSRAE